MDSYSITEQSRLDEAEQKLILDGIAASDPPGVGARDYVPLVLVLRDADGGLAGALTGATMWRWLHVDTLWIAPELRGETHGTRLLLAAERIAESRGCTQARLDTFDFQARAFYERLGWSVYATLPGFPQGHVQHHMRKDLAPSA